MMETQPYEIETYDKPVSDRDTATVYLEWRFGKPMVHIQFGSVSTSPQRALAIAEDIYIKTLMASRQIKAFSEGTRSEPLLIDRYGIPSIIQKPEEKQPPSRDAGAPVAGEWEL